jgi:hypothetical protein
VTAPVGWPPSGPQDPWLATLASSTAEAAVTEVELDAALQVPSAGSVVGASASGPPASLQPTVP